MNLYLLDLEIHHIFIIIIINSTSWLNLFLVKSKYGLISLQHNVIVDVSDLNYLLLNDEVQISFMLPLVQLNGNGEDNCTAHSLHVCFQCIENEFIHSYYELRLCTAHIHKHKKNALNLSSQITRTDTVFNWENKKPTEFFQ